MLYMIKNKFLEKTNNFITERLKSIGSELAGRIDGSVRELSSNKNRHN